MQNPVESLERSRKNEIRHALAKSFYAIVHTISDVPEDDINLYRDFTESEIFPRKYLKGKIKPDKNLKEHIRAYNFAKTIAEKIMILTYLCGTYAYSFLALFNPPRSTIDDSAMDVDQFLPDVEDEEQDESLLDQANISLEEPIDPDCQFKKRLDKRLFNKAKMYFLSRGAKALTAPQYENKFRERIDKTLVETIVDFFDDPKFIQVRHEQLFLSLSFQLPFSRKLLLVLLQPKTRMATKAQWPK